MPASYRATSSADSYTLPTRRADNTLSGERTRFPYCSHPRGEHSRLPATRNPGGRVVSRGEIATDALPSSRYGRDAANRVAVMFEVVLATCSWVLRERTGSRAARHRCDPICSDRVLAKRLQLYLARAAAATAASPRRLDRALRSRSRSPVPVRTRPWRSNRSTSHRLAGRSSRPPITTMASRAAALAGQGGRLFAASALLRQYLAACDRNAPRATRALSPARANAGELRARWPRWPPALPRSGGERFH